MVGYTSGGTVDTEFAHCLDALKLYDEKIGRGYLNHGTAWRATVVGTSIPRGRNKIVQEFLATECQWLWFIDTDQTFAADTLERMMATADRDTRPILSGMVMAYKPAQTPPVTPAFVRLDDANRLVSFRNLPATRLIEVAAVGAGCLLVHRSVYEKVWADAGDTAFPWFEDKTWHHDDNDGQSVVDAMGEDFVFSLRAGAAGFPILVDTDIQCGHRKTYEFTASDFWGQVPFDLIEPRTYVVVPVKDQRHLTESLLNQLEAQGGHHGVIVLDNGSAHSTRRYLDRQQIAEVISTPGVGIHHMWNTGAALALSRWPKVNLAFLNNDLNLGPEFLATLATELRARDDLVAISPNYDGRPLAEPVECQQICAGRYDGTGGAPGFAFMVKGELFQTGYQFPEDAMWWFGDNDLLMTILTGGGAWTITPSTTVEHINGGGQTGDWEAYQRSPQYEHDRQAFVARWAT